MPHSQINPALLYAAAATTCTAVACWWIRREGNRVTQAVSITRPVIDPETAAAAQRIHLRLLHGRGQETR